MSSNLCRTTNNQKLAETKRSALRGGARSVLRHFSGEIFARLSKVNQGTDFGCQLIYLPLISVFVDYDAGKNSN